MVPTKPFKLWLRFAKGALQRPALLDLLAPPDVTDELFRRGDKGAIFGDCRERINVIDFLISMTLLVNLVLSSGQGNHWGAGQIGVL